MILVLSAAPFSDPSDADIVLVAGDREFHVYKSVLCIASPVLESMLTSDFKEKDASKIPLPGKEPAAVEAFLLLISPKHYQEVTGT